MPGHIGRTHLAEASVHEHWTIATPLCDTSNGASFFLSEPAADKNPTQSQTRGPRDCSREDEGMLACRASSLTHPTPESLCARAGDVSDVFEQDYLYLSCSFSTDCKVLGHNVTNVTPRGLEGYEDEAWNTPQDHGSAYSPEHLRAGGLRRATSVRTRRARDERIDLGVHSPRLFTLESDGLPAVGISAIRAPPKQMSALPTRQVL
jgi:hypothetical protein